MTRKPWFWPAMIVGLLGICVLANVALLVAATSDPSFAVEEDYYDKALHWDDRRAQDARNDALGWTVDLAAVGSPGENAPVLELIVAVRAKDGAALDGADVRAEAFPIARSADVDRIALLPVGDGLYRASVPLRRAGLWEFRLEVVRGEDRFTWREQREVASSWPRS